jgi:hypothetical protein
VYTLLNYSTAIQTFNGSVLQNNQKDSPDSTLKITKTIDKVLKKKLYITGNQKSKVIL